MSNKIFRGHTISTTWRPIPELGNWPLDHVFVSTSDGMNWGCFGRGLPDEPNARVIAQGGACVEWIVEIAGQGTGSFCAGVTHQVNGICHHAANRLLLPAGVNVSDAPGNEIATPIFGKYGLGLLSFVRQVKDAAYRVNQKTPDLVSDEMVEKAVAHITHSKEEEIEILKEDLQEFLKINANQLPRDSRSQLLSAYSKLYTNRDISYADLMSGQISPESYKEALRKNIVDTLENVKSVIGNAIFLNIFRLPPAVAARFAAG